MPLLTNNLFVAVVVVVDDDRADQHQHELAALRAQVHGLGLGPAQVHGLGLATPPISPPKRPPSSSSPPLTGEMDQLRKQTAMMEVQARVDKDTISR